MGETSVEEEEEQQDENEEETYQNYQQQKPPRTCPRYTPTKISYPGKTSDGDYNLKPRHRVDPDECPRPMTAYQKNIELKAKLRARRTDDPTYKLRKYDYDMHRERVRNVKPLVDSTCPYVCKNVAVSQTKFNRSLANFAKIERENARMLARIAVIMQGTSTTVGNRLKFSTKNLNNSGKFRQIGLMRITFDNLHLLQRIEEQKPTYSMRDQLRDYAKAEKEMAKLSYYPLFWKAKKPSEMDDFQQVARMNAKRNPRPKVFLDFETDKPEGRVVIELRADLVPLTAESFRGLCTGEYGPSYKCTTVSRVVKNILIQGGDISSKGGTMPGFAQVYPEEISKLKHSEPGIVTMVNYGTGYGGSQFMILARKLRSLDGSNIAFGKVVEGMDIIKKFFEYVGPGDKPKKVIWITSCGQLEDGCGQAEDGGCADDDEDEDCVDSDTDLPEEEDSQRPEQSKKKGAVAPSSGGESSMQSSKPKSSSKPPTDSDIPSGKDDFYDTEGATEE